MTNMVVERRFGQLSVVNVYMVGGEERVGSWLERIDVEPDESYFASPQVGWRDPEADPVLTSSPNICRRLQSAVPHCSKPRMPRVFG